MENATKALIIAGSVLIAIALIAIGVSVLNNAQAPTDQVEGTMQTTEVSMFNNKFLAYAGENKSGAEIKSLVNLIISNNATAELKVNITYSETKYTSTEVMQTFISQIDNNKKYTVTYEFGSEGYVNNAIISET